MKQNKVKLYATALAEILAEKKFDEKKVTSNFVKLLVSAGLEKKSKEILELAEEILLTKRGNKKIVIESARKITAGQRKVFQIPCSTSQLLDLSTLSSYDSRHKSWAPKI